MNYLDRNEFNFEPSPEVIEAIRNFDLGKLCFYTRIYDQGKKSILSVYLSELYGLPEEQVILGYGAEDLLKPCTTSSPTAAARPCSYPSSRGGTTSP